MDKQPHIGEAVGKKGRTDDGERTGGQTATGTGIILRRNSTYDPEEA